MTLNSLKKFTAEFFPINMNTLREEAKQYIGNISEWQAAWVIEDGEYKDQWACLPMHESNLWGKIGWVPKCDLKIIEMIHITKNHTSAPAESRVMISTEVPEGLREKNIEYEFEFNFDITAGETR